MKDVYQVLQAKEAEIARVRNEVESLRTVSLLLSNESKWKDAHECLRLKEEELADVRREVESLQIVAPLLSDDVPFDDPTETVSSPERQPPMASEATGTDGPFSGTSAPSGKLWRILKRKA
jgi:hypothetical protein